VKPRKVAILTAGGLAPCLSSAIGGLIERYTARTLVNEVAILATNEPKSPRFASQVVFRFNKKICVLFTTARTRIVLQARFLR
jgi:hypothetical protein